MMQNCKWGKSRLAVFSIGYGCIGMSHGYGTIADKIEMIFPIDKVKKGKI